VCEKPAGPSLERVRYHIRSVDLIFDLAAIIAFSFQLDFGRGIAK
jgi:hypothetical protein